MSFLKDQCLLLRDFLRAGFRRTALWCAVGMAVAAAAGFVAALAFPQLAEAVIARFMAMVDETGIVDESGALSSLGLLANNWGAMLVSALYGFIPFLFLPVLSLASNGLLLGLMGGFYQVRGVSLLLYLAGILPHGVFELPALVLSVACGVTLCQNMCRVVTNSPKRVPMVELGGDLLRVMLLMVFPMTVIAALLEAYVTPLVMSLFL